MLISFTTPQKDDVQQISRAFLEERRKVQKTPFER
jgi:hypothetical protein